MNPLSLALHVLAIATLLIAIAMLWQALRRRQANRWAAAVAGAITFVIAARVLEPLALHGLGLTSWLGSTATVPVWVVFAFALAAATFEEFGRLAGLAAGWRRSKDLAAWTWSFAVGYAGAELLLIGVAGHGQLLAIAQSPDGGAALLQTLPPEAQASLQRSLRELGAASALWLVIERLAAVAFQVGFTLLVATAIARVSPRLFVSALLLHLLVDLPAAAYQVDLAPLWLVEVIYLVAGSVVALRIRRHWKAGGSAHGPNLLVFK